MPATKTVKVRAPRNQTLNIAPHEQDQLMSGVIQLARPVLASDLVNTLIHQDLLACLEYLPSAFIDLLVIDPPYNLSKTYAGTKFSKTNEQDYIAWLNTWIGPLKRSLKPQASLYVCCDWQSSKAIQTVLEQHFVVRNRITWEREKGRGALSNWKNCSEDIWFCTMGESYYYDVEAVKLKRKVIAPYRTANGAPKDWSETATGNFRLTHPSNLWTDISIPFWSMPENTDHPTQKPEKLIAKLILASSKEGDIVFDPFMGSGTTAVVAKKLNRVFAGVEREAPYCQMTMKRLQHAQLDREIQGYSQGFFWERNSGADQKYSAQKNNSTPQSSELQGLLCE